MLTENKEYTLVKDIDRKLIESFDSKIYGEVIFPGDPLYEEARKVYNAMIDKYPGMIVRCADVADVVETVNFARENHLLVAVRGGGHNGGGLGVCEGGLVIDLSAIRFVRVHADEQIVTVGGGNVWAEVDKATHPFGLAIPAGIISTTGVGGLTLGGGVGYLSRKYGLTIDSLLEAEMVLADGQQVTVNEDQYADLFWAIRGGGGNFGIVTAFTFQGHPVENVFGGPTLWPIEKTPEILDWYQEFIKNAPDDLNGFFLTLTIPGPPFPEHLHNKQFCGVVWCYLGGADKVKEVFKPVRDKQPIFEHMDEMPYPGFQSLFDGMLPPGLQWYWRADFFNELNNGQAEIHLQHCTDMPSALSQMHLYPISGAASRIADDATAWAYRDAKYAGVIVGVDPNPDNAGTITKWCKEYWKALHPYSSGGAYVNFLMDEGQDRVRASYRHNYERLTKVKLKYDPDNLFRTNQNILPYAES
ncbi:MAG: FAD-binding oxidoreductase [Ginsengibacter sp.]